ncbi:noncanonical pyrimidine nucleotidase, YjjG family [Flavobacterium sp. MAH-1]|uniref:Noncanonical pyrimidine nucleotidase, YjjG family n=1 Tax=Flavobacterium agri TaxID=2743471 RepID=A0A7Y8Y3W0_9FLAO|nr:YjjG family noncanonical pyrimidine nucleotidase [Flavobacterium agri]NUY80796.1 noncanonical pyrimidine nucleotidase, YjjG family [Flavobacterium agri]NYA70820.1 noncanonical pyrimidine nucleotidase, YjjG family [Flavobacterium agri]
MAAHVRDIFFDLDHTLWDFEKNSALAFETIFEQLEIEADLEAFLKFYVPINHEYWEKYRKDEITHEELRFGRFRKAFHLLGFEISDELVMRVSSEYIQCLPLNNHLFEGTIEVLDYLKAKYNLHIITNGFHDVQSRKLENAGIGHYFATVTNSEKAGVKKPNPLIFEHALSLAKTKKEQSLMIGDCIDADVRGALNCGIDAILFCPDPEVSYEGIKQISNLSELKKYL